MRHVLLILSVVWMGCLGAHEPEYGEIRSSAETETGTDPSFDFELSWVPAQGGYVLGKFPDSIPSGENYLSVSTQPVNRPKFKLSVSPSSTGARLIADSPELGEHYEGTNPWFVGLVLATSNGGRIAIRDVGTPEPSHVDVEGVVAQPTTSLYALDYYKPNSDGPPEDYCQGAGGTVVFAGAFDRTRRHIQSDAVSFGCANGIELKCLFWGYRPGNAGPSSPEWRYHQTCGYMGNAIYCTGGLPRTRELTPIEIRDNVPNYGSDGLPALTYPATPPGDLDTFYVEAAWDDRGAPICLRDVRWEALKPHCPADLPPSCHGLSPSQLFNAGALMINGSTNMDMPLRRWLNPKTGDRVLTVRGDYRPASSDQSEVIIPPFPGYTTFLGTYGMLMRTLPGILARSAMRPIYMQNLAGGDRYLSDTPGGVGSFEGYAFLHEDTPTLDGEIIPNLPPFRECKWPSGDRDSGVEGFMVGCTPTGKDLGFAMPPPPP